jgi:hypothetical protein
MATQVQFRRGTTTQNNAFTGAVGELTYDTEIKTLRIHDGSTPGGGTVVLTNSSSQTATNKTFSTGSVWNGSPVALAYGGTGAALTAVAGAVAYSTGSALALSAAGTSGQILISGGTGAPTWVNASSVTAGTATTATYANNINGGSAGQLIIQQDTGLTTFITAGASGTFLRSAGAGYAPTWATADVTIGSTVIPLGGSNTSLAGLNILAATGTSHWLIPVGTTAQRPGTPSIGSIRYNSDLVSFEGYSSGAWSSLGGVSSVDKYTYIRAETSAGASNGDLDFFAKNAAGNAAQQVGQWNKNNLKDYTGTLVGTQTTQNVFNTTATTVNAFGAATALSLGASSGTTTINNGLTLVGAGVFGSTLAVNGNALTTTSSTFNLVNTGATTLNIGGAATSLSLGASSGTTTVNNNLTVTGNLVINGTTITSNSTTTNYADPLLELNYSNGGVLTSDNGKDIGLRFHYYKTSDKNAALVLANDTQMMEFYVDGTETSGVFSGTYGYYRAKGYNYAGVAGLLEETFNATTSSTTPTAIYSFAAATYRSGELTIQVTNGTAYRILKMLVIHDGTNVTLSENYGVGTEIQTGATNTTFSGSIAGGTLTLYATASSGTSVVKGKVSLIKV